MKNISVVFFDLYNTLIYLKNDTRPYIDFFKKIVGKRDSKRIRKGLNLVLTKGFPSLIGIADDLGVSIAGIDNFEKRIEDDISSVALYDDTEYILRWLNHRGIRICIISNLSTPYKKPCELLWLGDLVEKCIYSCDFGVKKPDKRIYMHACSVMGVKSKNALMVGDSVLSDYYGAKNAGLNSILLDHNCKYCAPRSIGRLSELTKIIK